MRRRRLNLRKGLVAVDAGPEPFGRIGAGQGGRVHEIEELIGLLAVFPHERRGDLGDLVRLVVELIAIGIHGLHGAVVARELRHHPLPDVHELPAREEPEPRRPPVLEHFALDGVPSVARGATGLADAAERRGAAFGGVGIQSPPLLRAGEVGWGFRVARVRWHPALPLAKGEVGGGPRRMPCRSLRQRHHILGPDVLDRAPCGKGTP